MHTRFDLEDQIWHGNKHGEGCILGVSHAIVDCSNASPGLSAIAEVLRMMEVMVSTRAIGHAYQIVITNKPTPGKLFTGPMPFLLPNQQCQSSERNHSFTIYSAIICSSKHKMITLVVWLT